MDEPAHEEEDKRNDAEDADNHGDSDEDGRGSEGGGENVMTACMTAMTAYLKAGERIVPKSSKRPRQISVPSWLKWNIKIFKKIFLRDLANNLLTIRCRIMQISLQDGSLVLWANSQEEVIFHRKQFRWNHFIRHAKFISAKPSAQCDDLHLRWVGWRIYRLSLPVNTPSPDTEVSRSLRVLRIPNPLILKQRQRWSLGAYLGVNIPKNSANNLFEDEPNWYFQAGDYYSCVRISGYKLPQGGDTRPSSGLNVSMIIFLVKLFWTKNIILLHEKWGLWDNYDHHSDRIECAIITEVKYECDSVTVT